MCGPLLRGGFRFSCYCLKAAENKEIARDVWLRLKQAGLQLRNPPILFGPEEDTTIAKAS